MKQRDHHESYMGRMSICVLVMLLVAWPLPAVGQEVTDSATGSSTEDGAKDRPTPRTKLLMLPVDRIEGNITSLVTQRIEMEMRKNVQKHVSVQLLPSFEEIRKRLVLEGKSSVAISEAEQFYASGLALLTAGENNQAAKSFQRSIELMESNIGDVSNYDALADALANLALAHHNLGDKLEGKKRIKEYAHLRPLAILSTEKYPGALLAFFEAEQKKIKRAGPGVLMIDGHEPGSKVFLDGVPKGVTPVTVKDVGFGYHHLVIRDDKEGVYERKIWVQGGGKKQSFNQEGLVAGKGSKEGKKKLPTFYESLREQLRTGEYSIDDVRSGLRALGAQSGADAIGWMLVYKKGFNYKVASFVYQNNIDRLVQLDDVQFNYELSDVPVRIISVAAQMALFGVNAPKDRMVQEVVLTKKSPALRTKNTRGSKFKEMQDVSHNLSAHEQSAKHAKKESILRANKQKNKGSVPLPPPPDPEPRVALSMWTYVGYGAAGALLFGGLVAGSIVLWTAKPASPTLAGDGFSAEVSW